MINGVGSFLPSRPRPPLLIQHGQRNAFGVHCVKPMAPNPFVLRRSVNRRLVPSTTTWTHGYPAHRCPSRCALRPADRRRESSRC